MSTTKSTPNPIWSALRLLVVAAAGAGGWFAYDTYIAEDASAVAAEQTVAVDAVAPWPADLVLAVEPWTGNTRVTVQPPDDVIRQQMDFEASTGRVKMTLFSPTGSVSGTVETDGYTIYMDEGEGAGWQDPRALNATTGGRPTTTVMIGAAYSAPATTLTELVPPEVWAHTRLLGDEVDVNGVRTIRLRIKGAAFADAMPAVAAQWRLNSVWDEGRSPVDLEIGLDATGHVVSLATPGSSSDVQFRFAEVPEDPVFTSPLAS